MSNSLNLSLTNELRHFIDEQSGENSLYSTPSEYVRDLIRRDREKHEISRFENSVLNGYQDFLEGHYVKFSGDLEKDMKELDKKEKNGWK